MIYYEKVKPSDGRKEPGMPARASITITLALLMGFIACFVYAGSVTAEPPAGFTDTEVTDVPLPTALDFTPDGRMLVTSKSGQLHVYDQSGNELSPPAALDIESDVCSNAERGLLGVAVDSTFDSTTPGNDYVYLYYTFNKHNACPKKQPARNDNPVNRISRFTMTGNTLEPTSELVLINNIPSPNGNHNAGDLKFGKDGNLYVSVGDGGCNVFMPGKCQYFNAASRHGNVLLGKILRIDPDGSTPQDRIPSDNPYTGPDSAPCSKEPDGVIAPGKNCRETYLRGFRNPFRFAVDPDAAGTALRVNDVGGKSWEEIDRAMVGAADAGNDYGWNLCEGRHDNPYLIGKVDCTSQKYKGPIHEYSHSSGCESITGGAFVPDGAWDPAYDDAYLFGDFVCGKIFKLTPKAGGGFERTLFASVPEGGRPVAMEFGPNGGEQALYYTTFVGSNGHGQVRRVVD
ncbi:MAG TPA: PQQ-dependent sugar dehydrogenase [Rubrobacter sp.]|nr:PQQ-dependent sugar dehydrogenase [Rubrobacter sp.]